MLYTTLDNGDIVFPKKGKPPEFYSENFTRDPKDPFLFHANFIPCRYRLHIFETLPCGKCIGNWKCSLKGITISAPFCRACDVDPKT